MDNASWSAWQPFQRITHASSYTAEPTISAAKPAAEALAKIVVRGEGLCCYLDPAPTEAARRSNRRVEVRLVGLHDGLSDNNRSNNRKGA